MSHAQGVPQVTAKMVYSKFHPFDFYFMFFILKYSKVGLVNSAIASWCSIQCCINCQSLLMINKISAKCNTLQYIEIKFLLNLISIKTTNSRASADLDLISNKDTQKILPNAVDKIIEYCKKWGFKINEKKTCYTTFTKAGHRKNYEKTYGMKIKIGNSQIPIEPNPTFLGKKLDPKIDYKEHLKIINSKQISKINLIRKVKSFKWGSSIKINIMLYMSLIRSLLDYCFIILHSGTQKIKSEIQKMQNRILKIIKYFPLKTSIITIHKELKIDLIDDRANKLFLKFVATKQNHELIANETKDYLVHSTNRNNSKYKTPFDCIPFLPST
ncbi:AP-like endonuclease reverse transcriptase [Brachionus plicatilis]|uniref:AP-like endonuclease reverse transcriptase n=1 Tax=Brachionus plicatilis TaxID=10195 RepID=A0A3M7RIU0_BRAPC|nr:AP-like endonuclease reverse transcriptase [Brachionus plicatilis]